ncbi:unnamed protein product [Fraxinus pennsylvanica]|uniref:Uncharacterized protein n=1 Tax=Fraxinus pennsylvanica TaxID=56036 RepID=A0AAD2A064_9LAMI|nr:unnamed protein product [Fraxinus pennsylvanica]
MNGSSSSQSVHQVSPLKRDASKAENPPSTIYKRICSVANNSDKPGVGRKKGLLFCTSKDWKLEDWYFKASLFLPFQELRNLSLFRNQLVGWIENEGFDKLSKLRNLVALDLGLNSFDHKNLSSLSWLSSLKYLGLRYNYLERENYSNVGDCCVFSIILGSFLCSMMKELLFVMALLSLNMISISGRASVEIDYLAGFIYHFSQG